MAMKSCKLCQIEISRSVLCTKCGQHTCGQCHWLPNIYSSNDIMCFQCVPPPTCPICNKRLLYEGVSKCEGCGIKKCLSCARYEDKEDGTFSIKCKLCAPHARGLSHGEERDICKECNGRTMTTCTECKKEYCESCHNDGLLAQWSCEECAVKLRNHLASEEYKNIKE